MGFDAVDVSWLMIREVGPLVGFVRQHDADLADQLKRAATSVVLNLSEGNRRQGRDRRHHFNMAAGSAAEARDGLRLAIAWGHLKEPAAAPALELLDRQLALLWRLTHTRRV